MGRLILILGGAKSGKTALALKMAGEFPEERVYLATAQAHDTEMAERIRRHQAERGPEWRTVEEPLDPAGVIRGLETDPPGVVLMDCLTLWLSNLMAGQGLDVDEAAARVEDLAGAAAGVAFPVIVVSNEVGLGIVPQNRLAREFRDAAGRGHQVLAEAAKSVFFVTAGLPRQLK